MGEKTFSTHSDQYYQNLVKMMQEFRIPHEGDPDAGLEMLDMLLKEDKIDKIAYERMTRILSDGLVAHEGGIANYENMVCND